MENALYEFLFTRWVVSENELNSWLKIARAHFPWNNLYILTIEYFDDVIPAFLRLFVFGWLFVYIVKRTLHVSSKTWNLCSRGKNNISLFFLPREHKFHMFSTPCNSLTLFCMVKTRTSLLPALYIYMHSVFLYSLSLSLSLSQYLGLNPKLDGEQRV